MRNHETNGATLRRQVMDSYHDAEHRATRVTDVNACGNDRKVSWRRWRGNALPKGDWSDARGTRSDKSRALRQHYKVEAADQLDEMED